MIDVYAGGTYVVEEVETLRLRRGERHWKRPECTCRVNH
jgi:hypothetical protein